MTMSRLFDQMNCKRVGTSHEGRFSYWESEDRYIYQINEITREFCGWFCSLPAWERTFSSAIWITLEPTK